MAESEQEKYYRRLNDELTERREDDRIAVEQRERLADVAWKQRKKIEQTRQAEKMMSFFGRLIIVGVLCLFVYWFFAVVNMALEETAAEIETQRQQEVKRQQDAKEKRAEEIEKIKKESAEWVADKAIKFSEWMQEINDTQVSEP